MRSEVKRNAILLVMIAVALIFSTFTITYSWISSNREVNSNGFTMQAGGDTNIDITSAYVITYNETAGSYTYFDFKKTVGDLTMASYDTIFVDKNSTTSLILRITIDGALSSGGTQHFTFESDENTSYYLPDTTHVNPKISNVLSIGGQVSSFVDVDGSNAATVYIDAITALASVPTSTFVVDQTNTHRVEFDLNYGAGDVVDGQVTFDLILRYDDELAKVYHNSYDDIYDLHFGADLISLTLS